MQTKVLAVAAALLLAVLTVQAAVEDQNVRLDVNSHRKLLHRHHVLGGNDGDRGNSDRTGRFGGDRKLLRHVHGGNDGNSDEAMLFGGDHDRKLLRHSEDDDDHSNSAQNRHDIINSLPYLTEGGRKLLRSGGRGGRGRRGGDGDGGDGSEAYAGRGCVRNGALYDCAGK